jgi:hypothetical protein
MMDRESESQVMNFAIWTPKVLSQRAGYPEKLAFLNVIWFRQHADLIGSKESAAQKASEALDLSDRHPFGLAWDSHSFGRFTSCGNDNEIRRTNEVIFMRPAVVVPRSAEVMGRF